MIQVFVGIGSNIDRDSHIGTAANELHQAFGPLRLSTVYESEAIGFKGPNFFNLAAGFVTHLEFSELVNYLRNIEYKYGRPTGRMTSGNRKLDIDLLTYGRCCGEISSITIPRPEITVNAYVLCPLAEIVPNEMHPRLDKSYQQLWQEYDRQNQKLWPIDFDWKKSPQEAEARLDETDLFSASVSA